MERSEVLFSKGGGLQPYSKLAELARAVCYIEVTSSDPKSSKEDVKHGSGFYCKLTVDGSVRYGLITNNHVLKSRDACKAANAFFLYEKSGTGLRVKLRPEKFFRTHAKPLDYTFVGISQQDIKKIPDLQPIEMETEPEPAEGDQIIIFQHPRGRPKECSNDKILRVEKPLVRYKADTENGSSGSPVVTTNGWKLIAVHQEGSTQLGYNTGTLCSEILMHLRTGTCAPPAKRPKLSQDECNRLAPTDEMLRKLSQDIASFWKDLGIKLKVPFKKITAIQNDNVPYPGVTDKALQMLMVWKEERSDVATVKELSEALKALGKNRTEMEHCGDSSFKDDTAM
ncbi:uncharacterized protein LOC114977244 isoform X2 [Acropora millepora]|uniref:uncharacterized protein LOC114977244 isoform X2 n=1 Tax=Acropora millepora TaxID=45264 RepID=UPI001CF37183|nr:uncharacterized protein LOC114977244 isoform X2 [Acropora millepora]